MKIISKENLMELIKYNLKLGIKKDILIENSAQKVIKNIDLERRDTFSIIAGTGITGAIGLCIARNLISYDKIVYIYIINTQKNNSEEYINQLKILKNINININYLDTIEELSNFPKNLEKSNTIIDAITGIDYDSDFVSTFEYIIMNINKSRIYTISVDIPSGLDYDKGKQKIEAVDPDLIITFHAFKEALNVNTRLCKTKIVIENIGLLEKKHVRY